MHRRLSFLLALGLLLSFASPALAAPPGNDMPAGAVTIGSIPFTVTVDTTEATTGPEDTAWNESCGAPATDASVWYRYTATADSTLLVDTSESTYTAGVAILTGAPGSFTTVACGPTAVIFSIAAGETVWIVVFDDQLDEAGNGGTLQLSIMEAPPAPTVDVTVNPIAHFDPRTGTVTVSGTVTCTGGETVDNFIDVQVRQQVGRFFITGFGGTSFTCDETSQPWTVEVFSENGLFKGGKATSVTFAVSCDLFQCGSDFEEVTLRLRRAR